MKAKIFIALWALAMLPVTAVFGQDPLYKNFSVAEGLPGSTLYSICQDPAGYIWVASNTGVSRFDGTGFVNYSTDSGLQDNTILKVRTDRRRRVWFLALNGKTAFFKNGHIFNENNDPMLRKLQMEGNVVFCREDAAGNIWFLNKKSLRMLDTKDSIWIWDQELQNRFRFSPQKIMAPTIGQDGKMAFYDPLGKRYFFDGKGFEKDADATGLAEINEKLFGPLASLKKIKMVQDLPGPGERLFLTDNEFGIVKDGQIVFKSQHENGIFSGVSVFFEDKDLNIWFVTGDGLLLFDRKNPSEGIKHFFSPVFFTDGMQDNEGNCWFSSFGSGLFMVPSPRTMLYKNENVSRNCLMVKLGVSFANRVLAGSINGDIFEYEGDNFHQRHLSTLKASATTTEIFTDSSHHTWVVSGNYLDEWDGNTYKRYSDTVNWFKSAILSKHGGILVGGALLLERFEKGRFEVLYRFGKVNRIYSLLETGDSILLGTESGLYLYRKGKMTSLAYETPLFSQAINDLKHGESGTVWVATDRSGAVVMQLGKVAQMQKSDGLLCNNITRLWLSKDQVFVASLKGVNFFDYHVGPAGKVVFGKVGKANIPICEINDLLIQADTLWMASDIGIIKCPAFAEAINGPLAPSYITNFIVNHVNLPIAAEYRLPSARNNIEIRFTGISYGSFGHINFRYRLAPRADWNYTSTPVVVLHSLSDGEYHFEVETQNAEGEWNPVSAEVSFQIDLPLWRQWRFMALANLALIALILVLVRVRLRQIKYREDAKRQTILAELKALRAQLNPHFIFNSLNSIQDFVLSNQKYEASAYLADFAKLMRMILDNSQKQAVSLQEESEFLEYYIRLEQLRFQKRFEYQIETANDIDERAVQLPSMFLQPFVENAIIHGLSHRKSGGLLKIVFEKKDRWLRCTVSDNGIGREAAERMNPDYASKERYSAMQIIHERLTAYNAGNKDKIVLQLHDGAAGSGTEVTIDFPMEIA